jgi:alanyl-tRNA synthetase
MALRDKPDVRAVVLGGEPDGGGAALVAATTADSGLTAGELIAAGKQQIQGGGSDKDPRFAMAGGRNADGVDAALDLARAAAGIA